MAFRAVFPLLMQTTLLPFQTLQFLEKKKNQDFLWGDTASYSKLHIVAWNKICLLKERGGLGLKHMKVTNSISLARTVWNLLRNHNHLWAQVLYSKYGDI